MPLFNARSVEEAIGLLRDQLKTYLAQTEEVELALAYNRVLAEDVISSEDIPGFNRSTVDGFAVIAKDTYGASEAMPAILTLTGEVKMGENTNLKLSSGQAVKISTGGMLPLYADSVVMLEYTHSLDDDTLLIERPVAPGDNVVAKGEDIKNNSIIMKKGHTLRPQDLGALAGMGIDKVKVIQSPRVAVISTGDELRPPGEPIKLGEVRDINTYALCGQILKWGGMPMALGIFEDNFDVLYKAVNSALEKSDVVLISGGSSVGARDHTVEVIEKLGNPGVLAHGLPVKPGKPTILASVKGKPIIGLPGHPVSAMVIFELIVRPLLSMMLSRDINYGGTKVYAKMSRNVASAAGRQDFIRVKLEKRDKELWAIPILGKSGLISTMVESHGLAQIPPEKQGILKGEPVEVEMF